MSQYDSVFALTCYQAGFPLLSSEITVYDIASKVAKTVQEIASNIFQMILNAVYSPRPIKIAIPATTENEILEKSELLNYNTPNVESFTKHFSSSNCEDHPFPYDIPGLPRENEYNKATYHHFTKQIISFSETQDPIELFNACLNGVHGDDAQKKAFHASAVMKLLGDKNNPVSFEINSALKGQFFDSIPSHYGKLKIVNSNLGDGAFKFQVTDETIDMKNMSNETIGQYTTSRTITVLPPDQNRDVHYSIERSFQVIQ